MTVVAKGVNQRGVGIGLAGACVFTALSMIAACASSAVVDEGLGGVALDSVSPQTITLGSRVVLDGESFVAQPWGTSTLRLSGILNDDAGERTVDVIVEARFVDFDVLEFDADADFFDSFGAGFMGGEFSGDAVVEVVSGVDGKVYATTPVSAQLTLARNLEPRLDVVQSGGLIFVNDPIEVRGDGMLLGGGEGETFAVVQGCFTAAGDTGCKPVGPIELAVTPDSRFDRKRGTLAFEPAIAGIKPGVFTGSVILRNRPANGDSSSSGGQTVDYELIGPEIFTLSPTSASLGQYVNVTGGGFVGGETGADTLLQMRGFFLASGAANPAPVDLLLVPEFVSGPEIRYVLSEDDSLGQSVDLRRATGTFSGTVTPIVSYGGEEVTGNGANFTLEIAPVRQVVHVVFRPTYVESLRHFGLRAVDAQIRKRVVDVVERDYATINLQVRLEEPKDFAVFSQVEVAGPDPNGLGLFGYDNTPGKDVGNERLYDRIGGVNATTQDDGFPGFGGVFLESFFGFSEHPGDFGDSLSGADARFDDIFDPFRSDRGGSRVTASDVGGGVVVPADGLGCPAATGGREQQLGCAVFVLGNLIGTTVSHELGHSLGLANPFGAGFHNSGDGINRIMDSGAARPFAERAELSGLGPAVFCGGAYDYLRDILPTAQPDDNIVRGTCF